MAEAVFRSQTNNLSLPSPSDESQAVGPPHPSISRIDSAGTAAYHTLEPPDPRTASTLIAHGIQGYKHGARKVTPDDFDDFDYIFAMDRQNLRNLKAMKDKAQSKKPDGARKADVRLFGEFGGTTSGGEEVADPYYGANNGFEVVYEQVTRFSLAFLDFVVREET
jgi:low molecular weight phosphotyrosine protein phosphatase